MPEAPTPDLELTDVARRLGGIDDSSQWMESRSSGLRRPGPWYGLWMITSALALIGASVVTFGLALRYTLVPLEGVPLDDAGEVLPLPPIRVAFLVLPSSEALEASAASVPTVSVPTKPMFSAEARRSLHRDVVREQALWHRSLELAGAVTQEVGAAWIPTDLTQAQLLVLPWNARLDPDTVARIERFVSAGGALLGQGALEPAEQLERWFQVHARPPEGVEGAGVAGAGANVQSADLGQSPRLELAIPPGLTRMLRMPAGRRAVVNRAVLPLERFDATVPLVVLQEEGRSLSPLEVGPPAPPDRVILAEGQVGAARTAWMGIQPDWLYGSPGRTHALQEALEALLPWLTDRPRVRVAHRAGPLVPDVALMVPPVSSACQAALASRLEVHGLTATWMLPAAQGTALELSLPGSTLASVGLEAPAGISGLGFGRLTLWLQGQAKALEELRVLEANPMPGQGGGAINPAAPVPMPGLRLSLEDDTPWIRDALRDAGVPFLIRRRASPRGWQMPEALEGPGLAAFWRVPPAWPWVPAALGGDAERLPAWLEGLRPEEAEGLRVLELGCGDEAEAAAPESLLVALAEKERWFAASVTRQLAERDAVREVVATLNPLRLGRYHLRVKGGRVRLEGLRIHLSFARGAVLESADSHQVGAPGLHVESTGSGEAWVEVSRLEPGRTWDWFLGVSSEGPR